MLTPGLPHGFGGILDQVLEDLLQRDAGQAQRVGLRHRRIELNGKARAQRRRHHLHAAIDQFRQSHGLDDGT